MSTILRNELSERLLIVSVLDILESTNRQEILEFWENPEKKCKDRVLNLRTEFVNVNNLLKFDHENVIMFNGKPFHEKGMWNFTQKPSREYNMKYYTAISLAE